MPGPAVASHVTAYKQSLMLASLIIPEDLTPEQSVKPLIDGGSHIVWLLGHLAISAEGYIGPRVGVSPTLPKEWGKLFGMGSKPVANAALYPSYAELRGAVMSSLQGLMDRIATLSEGDLDQAMPPDFSLIKLAPTLGAFLSFGTMHTNYHLGQITLLLRAQGLKGGVGG
jgi:hypothetical protein